MATFSLEVSYSQVAVFEAGLKDPFNDWTDAHVAQGFAWRPGSVSFRTLDEAGTMTTTVDTPESFDEASSSALRIIRVPFSVPETGRVEVASIGSSTVVELPPGDYELTFEHGRNSNGIMWGKLHFRRAAGMSNAQVMRADAELSPGSELLMTAEPACS